LKELRPETTPAEATKKSRLPEKTRGFVQHAFAHGAADALDERRKLLLVRYIIDDKSTMKELSKYAGVSQQRVSQLYYGALTRLWLASPPEVQQQFPAKEVFVAKGAVCLTSNIGASVEKRLKGEDDW
jgi:DNA-directed RNA polymerase sigma subunit (sigma70/sigma32)